MSYYPQQPPGGTSAPQGYPTQGYNANDAYPPPGYPQSYPPQIPPPVPPQPQVIYSQSPPPPPPPQKNSQLGCLEGWLELFLLSPSLIHFGL
nr:hypothetical protein CFP56_25202 [Quercus suber]